MTTMIAKSAPESLTQKLLRLHLGLLVTLAAISFIGVALLYSVADGSWSPWAAKHALRVSIGLTLVIMIGLIDIKYGFDAAYPLFILVLLLLIGVEFFGSTRMGAQRWLSFAGITVQPSELMKLALVLALARLFNLLGLSQVSHPLFLGIAIAMVFAPTYLVMRQPDLGTAIMIAASGVMMIFAAGLSWRWILPLSLIGAIGSWLAYNFLLHDYQKARITAFFRRRKIR